eukprot:TRINITY_DN2443_c0_g1_i1.p1 TRINITY_DN2443_c0_g1~~TRINITY_DN2443_c0_g1_i1.p1  ORF type:complete len:353 (-),score=47.91 TRINITY_DN2443_c0_g1_i1:113-1171(-)
MFLSTTTGGPVNPNKDTEVTPPPNDGISSLSWSPKANFLVSGSWDNQIRCWEVQRGGYGPTTTFTSQPKAAIDLGAPILTTTWSNDGTKVFAGCCDNKAYCWDLQTGAHTPAGQHDAPIKCVFWVPDIGCLLTGGWDKRLKYWDGRSPGPCISANLPDKLFCGDVVSNWAIFGTAERHMVIYDLRKPDVEFKKYESPLKFQSRCLSCFPDTRNPGYALGAIEGRVAIQYIEDAGNPASTKNFAFKCHRDGNNVYSINSISFHPVYGTFATCGSDGTFHFWDKDSKQRLKQFSRCTLPISTSSFNMDGTIYSYAVSYDWSKGVEYYNPANDKNYIFLHAATDDEIKNRAPSRK